MAGGEGKIDVLVARAATAMQRLAPPAFLAAHAFLFKQGDKLDAEALRARLTDAGYSHVNHVLTPGEFAVRGGIIDLFPMGTQLPFRIDLFDEEIQSSRTFDSDTQRTLYKVNDVRLLPARRASYGAIEGSIMVRRLFSLAALFIHLAFALSQEPTETRYVAPRDAAVAEKLSKWQDLKFGLFMHWGPYSQWGVVESWSLCPEDEGWTKRRGEYAANYFEYKRAYEDLSHTFNPLKFQPEKWVAAAGKAGMKYVVFTTKHHDGFCMFDTRHTGYRITDPGAPFSKNPRSNVTREIFDAFRKQGFWVAMTPRLPAQATPRSRQTIRRTTP